ncbi:hypothetical protein [Aneurinibacillus uraniidurans]|uniref:hypothetical protein n=1 Tax=Aneurinibacillus uraniidurans TaxID=2966586 RepID=UPI00234BFF3C|nr:hypothetical protein [Aneurinibacillus sp. B1]WCN36488.1 hypothetical protein PO771_11400 [Aneurinibacillus sp. B1]
MHILGIDCGLSYTTNSTGLCQIVNQQTKVFRTFSDKISKLEVLNLDREIDLICVDAPLLPNTYSNKRVDGNAIRVVETLFTLGKVFPSRCKPGHTHSKNTYDGHNKIVGNTGYGLRRAGGDTVVQFIEYLSNKQHLITNFPKVEPDNNFIETCPNVVLGILLNDNDYNQLPPKKKGRRDTFDRLYDYCQKNRLFEKLRASSTFLDHSIWTSLSQEMDHEKRAALICSLIGMLVLNESYVAIGDDDTGYFFLPPMDSWREWVKNELQKSVDRYIEKNGNVPIIFWSNGQRYNLKDSKYNYKLPV